MTAFARPFKTLPLMVGALALLLSAPAGAQPVARSFQELRGLVTPGQTIYVTDAGGLKIKGTLVDLSDSLLIMRTRHGQPAPLLQMSERDVNNIRIPRSDPWWNGPLIGLATGAIPGLLIELGGRNQDEKFSGLVAAGLGSIGLLTGLLIDAVNREKTIVFVHRAEEQPVGVGFLPRVSKSAVGVGVSIEF